jgi:hypothetical protein
MDNRTANPEAPATLLDELAFAKGSTFEIVGSVIRAEKATGRGWEIGSLMSVLEYGERLGRDLAAEAKHLAETAPSEEEIVRRYFRTVCAGKDPRKIFRHPGDDPQEDDLLDGFIVPSDFEWDELDGNERKGRIPVTEEVAKKAYIMAVDASRLMSRLNPHATAMPEYGLTLVARLAFRTPTGALRYLIDVQASYDYVAHNPGLGVFVGAYEIAPSFSVSEVRRHAGANHWGARAYLGKLLVSAYFGLPVEWKYVVTSSKKHCDITYHYANATSVDDLRPNYDFGSQEGPYPCRAYEIGGPSLEEGRYELHRSIYRLYRQQDHDAWYLRHETI